MFRFHKPRDLITLFHSPSSPASQRAHALLKSLNADSTAARDPSSSLTDPSSSHAGPSSSSSPSPASTSSPSDPTAADMQADFDLEVVTAPPTVDQVKSIFEFLQAARPDASISELVRGAREVGDVRRLLERDADGSGQDGLRRPATVDWGNGKVVLGDDEGQLVKMVRALKDAQ